VSETSEGRSAGTEKLADRRREQTAAGEHERLFPRADCLVDERAGHEHESVGENKGRRAESEPRRAVPGRHDEGVREQVASADECECESRAVGATPVCDCPEQARQDNADASGRTEREKCGRRRPGTERERECADASDERTDADGRVARPVCQQAATDECEDGKREGSGACDRRASTVESGNCGGQRPERGQADDREPREDSDDDAECEKRPDKVKPPPEPPEHRQGPGLSAHRHATHPESASIAGSNAGADFNIPPPDFRRGPDAALMSALLSVPAVADICR
jgi:hypothetical protein